jgi:protein SCO1/2
MKPKLFLILICAATLVAVLSAVIFGRHNQPIDNAHTRTFQVHGQIRSLDVTNKSVRIAHDEIPHYMPAMIMAFSVKDASLLKGMSAGDSVQFELAVTKNDSWISYLEKVVADGSSPAVAATGAAAVLQDREAERVQTGETVPDFNLIDQDGRTIHLSDYRGKAVLLTFIYTRCPLPNFCPLMSKHFADLEQRLNKEFPHKYQLLSVTMDPDFDRPKVLKDYAARYGASGLDWSFATGEAEQINFVAGLMGLYYARENGLISHDLRTALIGPDGRLVHLWNSNVWTPYEVQRMVRETLTGTNSVAAL